jgi:hypothetical protein
MLCLLLYGELETRTQGLTPAKPSPVRRGERPWTSYRVQHLVGRYLPQPKILHLYPKDRFRALLAAGAV